MRRIRSHVAIIFISTLLLALLVVLVACNGSENSSNDKDQTPTTEEPSTPEDGEASDSLDEGRLVEMKCSMCHSLDRVWAAEKTRQQWVVTVDRMKANGLVVTDEEYDVIVDHLATVSEK